MIPLRPIAREELIFFILAAAGDVRVPARCWALEVALEHLSKAAPGELAQAINNWPRVTTSSCRSFAGVDAILRTLAATNVLQREGEGWEAGYRLSDRTSVEQQRLLELLGAREQKALRKSAQKLIECLTTWSKKSVVGRPTKSGTI